MRSACLVQARLFPASWVRPFLTSTRTSSNESSPTPTITPKPLDESEPISRPPGSGPSCRKLDFGAGPIAKTIRPEPISVARVASLPLSQLESVLKEPHLKHQIYISHHDDPYTNLSIEHYLLQNSRADSRILFLYSNGRSVVIGRNQNPWLEVNLDKAYGATHASSGHQMTETGVSFVRRRSGGGTVYHDPGNLNYSIICPPIEFTRDKHALMVASALRSLGVKGARVNERHDIVVDRSGRTNQTSKVSGSAYKLTRQRALHHGTLLLNANLSDAKKFLRSPALEYIKARGVESVRSLIGNVASDVDPNAALHIRKLAKVGIIREFTSLYNLKIPSRYLTLEYVGHSYRERCLHVGDGWVMSHFFPEGWLPIAELEFTQGLKELRSREWRYDQTPQFTFSTLPTEEDPRGRNPLPLNLPRSTRIYLKVKNGVIIDSRISFLDDINRAMAQAEHINRGLLDQKLIDLGDWTPYLGELGSWEEIEAVGNWLNETLPSPKYLHDKYQSKIMLAGNQN